MEELLGAEIQTESDKNEIAEQLLTIMDFIVVFFTDIVYIKSKRTLCFL